MIRLRKSVLFLQDLLCNVLSVLVFLLHLMMSISALSRCPLRCSRLLALLCMLFSHSGTIEAQVLYVSQELEFLLVRRFLLPTAVSSWQRLPCSSASTALAHTFLTQSRSHIFRRKSSRQQLASGGLLFDHLFPFHTVYLCLTLLQPPCIIAASAKIDHVRCTLRGRLKCPPNYFIIFLKTTTQALNCQINSLTEDFSCLFHLLSSCLSSSLSSLSSCLISLLSSFLSSLPCLVFLSFVLSCLVFFCLRLLFSLSVSLCLCLSVSVSVCRLDGRHACDRETL